jgi:hypothetical protein
MIQISGDNLQFWVSEGLRKIDGHPKDSDGEVLKRVRDKQGWGVVHFCNTVCFAEFLKRGH